MKKPLSRSLLWLVPLIVLAVGASLYWYLFIPHQVLGLDPVRPFPYSSQEVSFVNSQAGVTLAGTLTLPWGRGPFPAVVIIGGAGPHLRDGYNSTASHKFVILADYLARHGIASLRYDKRGIGASTGNYANATSADFAQDAGYGVEYLRKRKEIDPAKVGLIGHSEGGVIAPMVAAHSTDVAFVVMMAGLGVTGEKNILVLDATERKLLGASSWDILVWQKMIFDGLELIKKENDPAALEKKLWKMEEKDLAPLKSEDSDIDLKGRVFWTKAEERWRIFEPWGRFLIGYEPQTSLSQVQCPLLVLSGDKDGFVPEDINILAIDAMLKNGKNKDYTIQLFADTNHGFQKTQPGTSDEPLNPQQGFSPEVLVYMTDWIKTRVR